MRGVVRCKAIQLNGCISGCDPGLVGRYAGRPSRNRGLCRQTAQPVKPDPWNAISFFGGSRAVGGGADTASLDAQRSRAMRRAVQLDVDLNLVHGSSSP